MTKVGDVVHVPEISSDYAGVTTWKVLEVTEGNPEQVKVGLLDAEFVGSGAYEAVQELKNNPPVETFYKATYYSKKFEAMKTAFLVVGSWPNANSAMAAELQELINMLPKPIEVKND